MAYLHAAPVPPDTGKRARGVPPPERVPRIKRLQADGIAPQMPPLPEEGAYLVRALFEVGPMSAVGMGALSWPELQAWQDQVGTPLQPWEARTLRRLSVDYAAERAAAESATALPPFAAPTTEQQREAVARRIKLQAAAERMAAEHSAAQAKRGPLK